MQITSKVKHWIFFSKIRIYQSKIFTAVFQAYKRGEKTGKQTHFFYIKKKKIFSSSLFVAAIFFVHSYMD